MTKERNIKTENTFSESLEEDTEPLWEEEPPQIVKVDKGKKKVLEEKRKGRIRKTQTKGREKVKWDCQQTTPRRDPN